MKPTPFDPSRDIAPVPFDERHCRAAAELKAAGLDWRPHVGCFVWDRDGHLGVPSPFPGRVYFVLNVGHFIRLLGSRDTVAEKLVWVPTWHQARVLCARAGVDDETVTVECTGQPPGEDVLRLYRLLLGALRRDSDG
jgi:hypothetical protein